MNIKDDSVFIIIISGAYGKHFKTHFINNLAKYIYPSKIIVIDRPIDPIVTLLKHRERYKEPGLKKIYENLFILTPFLPIYDQLILNSNKILKKINFSIFNSQFSKTLKSLGLNNYKKISWVMHPDLIDYLQYIKPKHIIYDMYDEYILNHARKNISIREKDLINLSDMVICISKNLENKKKLSYDTGKFIVSGSAINADNFKFNFVKKSLDDISTIKKPIVGFVGNIKKQIDLDLLQFIAESRPNISLVIIGQIPSKEYTEKFTNLSNVFFLGAKNYTLLQDYLSYFNVGIIPYKVEDEFIKNISPLKLYEYLASNIYVVSNPIPDVIEFINNNDIGKKKVSVAYDKEDFLKKIDYFIEKEQSDISFKDYNLLSWDSRFKHIFEKLIEKNIVITNS